MSVYVSIKHLVHVLIWLPAFEAGWLVSLLVYLRVSVLSPGKNLRKKISLAERK